MKTVKGHNLSYPQTQVNVDAAADQGQLELWRQSLGLGGINWLPLPQRVIEGVRKLQPRLVRIFIQEFFNIYPEHGRFDWGRLDPYMDSLGQTGAKIVAAITIKPRPLYPKIDPKQWQPTDVMEYQHVVSQLVKRYSVDRPLVTHWEIGNEPDIGEWGGCPFHIADGREYGEFYSMNVRPILETFPQAKVGGPAVAVLTNEPMPGFMKYCRQNNERLDFLSWHLYDSNSGMHAYQVRIAKLLAKELLGRVPELMVTEMNRRLDDAEYAAEDHAFDSRRAAALAAILYRYVEGGQDWSFHYHMWDQVCFGADFIPFFSPGMDRMMIHHWNECPHRLGLFGVNGEVRPQYFVYQMLSRLGQTRLAIKCDTRDFCALSGRSDGRICVLLVNYSRDEHCDRLVKLHFDHLKAGTKRLVVYRVDDGRHWCPDTLELLPVETRDMYTVGDHEFGVFMPADSVALACLEDIQ